MKLPPYCGRYGILAAFFTHAQNFAANSAYRIFYSNKIIPFGRIVTISGSLHRVITNASTKIHARQLGNILHPDQTPYEDEQIDIS